MSYEKEYGISFVVSFVIVCYGTFIYLLLDFVNIENIVLATILISSFILTYETTSLCCDALYDLHLKIKEKKREKVIP